MKLATILILALAVAVVAAPAHALPRQDVIWARVANGPIVLDGVLDEADWALAESHVMQWEVNAGIPGSGWKVEAGTLPVDPTSATIKFLTLGNELYLAVEVQDQSVGGDQRFNFFDGLLMAIKNHMDPGAPKPPAEYFYSWWYPDELPPHPQPPGQSPSFVGVWAELPAGAARTPEQIANWDAATTVQGLSNDDSVLDTGYTVEMRFNLTPMGYDVTQAGGDVVEWNLSIYDCDWNWPIEPRFSSNRVWWQGPWGNTAWYGEVRVLARPDVTVTSGPVPFVEPEVLIPDLVTAPVIDGSLSDPVWNDPGIYSFDLRYGDDALRSTYDGVGPFRAGQFQPDVLGGQAFIFDPGDATVKMFHVGDFLYVGVDVRDQYVQDRPEIDRWDGLRVSVDDRVELDPDNQLTDRELTFTVKNDGTAIPQEFLTGLVSRGDAQVALLLGSQTVVDTTGSNIDNGYTAEMVVDLKALGYPAGLGDRDIFIGVTLFDGDSFDDPPTDSYGTRTWWFREFSGQCCPAWAYLMPPNVTAVDPVAGIPPGYGYASSYPNPSRAPTIRYMLPDANKVFVEIYDVSGRLVERRELGLQGPGTQEYLVTPRGKSAGLYLYRVRMVDPITGNLRGAVTGKTMLLR